MFKNTTLGFGTEQWGPEAKPPSSQNKVVWWMQNQGSTRVQLAYLQFVMHYSAI